MRSVTNKLKLVNINPETDSRNEIMKNCLRQ